jgi:quercetin dioxygenase-like cupin family protein
MNEEILEQFKKEFPHVYEWKDEPGKIYKEHSHKGKVSLYVTAGQVDFFFPKTQEHKSISEGERFDVPPGIAHTAKVGNEGCSYIVGEMIEGDS